MKSRTYWQVKISRGFGCGIHAMRTHRAALEFIAQWRKGSNDVDAFASVLRNGVVVRGSGY